MASICWNNRVNCKKQKQKNWIIHATTFYMFLFPSVPANHMLVILQNTLLFQGSFLVRLQRRLIYCRFLSSWNMCLPESLFTWVRHRPVRKTKTIWRSVGSRRLSILLILSQSWDIKTGSDVPTYQKCSRQC